MIKTRKILLVVLTLVIAIVFSTIRINTVQSNPGSDDKNMVSLATFTNPFFTDTISKEGTAEEIVSFSDIYNIVETKMNTAYDTVELRDTAIETELIALVGSKRVGIKTPEDLYNFSVCASFNYRYTASINRIPYTKTIQKILGYSYVLLSDIDYSQMKAKKFVPIGTDITIQDSSTITYKYPFTGTFDGQGFVIKNLYLADYNTITTIYRFGDDPTQDTDVPLSPYYAMFNELASTAVVKNFKLENPVYELLNVPEGLTNTAYLVGINYGEVHNVAVIDKKTNLAGNDISGIRFNFLDQPSSDIDFTAAGFVHTNAASGKIYNSFFISKNVISTGSKFIFDVKPFFYNNNAAEGAINGAAYDVIVVPVVDSLVQPGVVSYTYSEFVAGVSSGTPIAITNQTLSGERWGWHYYPNDGLPRLFSLEYDTTNGYFKITDEYDMIAFSKLMNLTTKYNNIAYNSHNYRLMADIDMENVEYYQTPSLEFKGSFSGGDTDFALESTLNGNKYIMNLKVQLPAVVGSEYYLGMFGAVSGTIKNINFYNNEMIATNTKDHYGKIMYIGAVCGKSNNATIKNIISDTSIDLGSEALGSSYVGGIVGYGTGNLSYLVNIGNINGNTHNFNNLTTDGKFCIGGIVGGSAGSGLSLKYAKNTGNITTISSDTNYSVKTSDYIKISAGGIIGEVNNATTNGNSLYYLTNTGTIEAGSFTGKDTAMVYQNLGGIFGNATNYGMKLVESNGTTIRNGRFVNSGTIKATHVNDYTMYYTAGIGVASTTQTLANFSYMTNSGGFDFTDFTSITHNKTIFYSATMTDNSTGGITLSRAYNEANFTFGPSYFATATTTTKIAPFFTSITNMDSKLLFVENRGNITVGSLTLQTTVNKELRIAGITLATKIDYQNVYNSGDISVLRINNSAEEIYVAGIAWILPYNTSASRPYTAKNILNKGTITTAGISGNTEASAPGTTNAYSFPSTFTSRNLYVAGLFNINVGEITNSFNRGTITSNITSLAAELNDITGTANAFVGGLVTINYNLIQDVGNTGNIIYTNISTSSTTYVANITYGSKYGGLIIAYKGGLALGGIAAAFGDTQASILSGYGQNVSVVGKILDSANNGNIYGRAKEYVRSGGILAIALGIELTSGTDVNQETGAVKKFSYSVAGSGDAIINCELSNGLNFGNITAVTSSIGQYVGNLDTAGESSTSSNSERPGIFAAAGGVIGYGLTKMQRMLNHGVVAATDVAGGIVGATYILGGTSQQAQAVTYVNINTAVHYGKVKAIRTAKYSDATYSAMEYIYTDNIDDNVILYPDNDTTFIFKGNYNLSIYPNRKRGFGGIFGRLQRGSYGSMRSNNFVNILNMDPNIDMVGRVDQSSYGSLIYFLFKINGVTDTYYTARTNDTTQATLVGYNTKVNVTFSSATKVTYQITRSTSQPYSYTVTNVSVTSGSGLYHGTTRYVGVYSTAASVTTGTSVTESRTTGRGTFSSFTNTFTTLPSNQLSYYNLLTNDVSGLTYSNSRATLDNVAKVAYFYNNITLSYSPAITHMLAQYPIERVTDDTAETTKTNIFNTNFPLMNPAQSDYIYNADQDALAPRFQSGTYAKPNGMYVLASSKGRQAGAVLPGNIKINHLYSINEASGEYIDLTNVTDDNLITTGTDAESFETDFKKMVQVSYNEKSLILAQAEEATLADLILYDPAGVSPTLQGGLINDTNKTITFTVSSDAFVSSSVAYEVLSASLSEKAVIAKSDIAESEHTDFKYAYNTRTSNILKGSFIATLNGTVNSGETVTLPTKLTVYSEIASQVSSLVSKYKTEYSIIIVRQATSLNISLSDVYVNEVSATVPSLVDNTYTITSHQVSASGSIALDFLSGNGLLPLNHNIKFVELKYGATTIDSDYYSVEYTPVDATDHFGFKITIDGRLKAGTYTATYRYYANTADYYIVFTKATSSEYSILDVEYISFSSDSLNEEFSINPQTTDFSTYIGFGIILDGFLYNTNNSNITINKVIDGTEGFPTYLDNTLYYELIYDEEAIVTVYLSPFASLSSITTEYTFVNGVKEYIIDYTIEGEDEEPHSITQTIIERGLPTLVVYKNGNSDDPDYIEVYREDLLTEIFIDFGFSDSTLNENVTTTIYKDSVLFEPSLTHIYFDAYTYYEISITSLLEVGLKEYVLTLERETGIYLALGTVYIDKLLGQDAYLKDVRFQLESEQTVIYPDISVASSLGEAIASPYYPMFYYDGIDYDNANTDDPAVVYFRIDGKVSDIDLEYYHPIFYLPLGATIERYDGSDWTADLYTDYIGDEETSVVIQYRVMSEDGQNTVYYFLTAEDMTYILTIRFTIFFQAANGTIYEAKDTNSLIKDDVVLINIKNYTLKEKDEYDVPIEYIPTVDEDGKNHYPYEDEGIKNYVTGLNTQSTLFYFPTNYTNYLYTFSRNLAGAYGFSVITPVYNGTSTQTLTNGKRYTYSIYLSTNAVGEGDYPWYSDKYILPDFETDNIYSGKYFYILGSPRQIIRQFAIVIHEETFGQEWGLNDDFASWDK